MSKVVHLSESVLIGIHCMALIAKKSPESVNVKIMASITGASENTIAKVMQRLAKLNLIHSTRGPQGGFLLGPTPDQISLLEIYEAIEGKLELNGCPFNKNSCVLGDCIFGNFINDTTIAFIEKFQKITLDQYR